MSIRLSIIRRIRTFACALALLGSLASGAAAHAATTTVRLSVPAPGKASVLLARTSGVQRVSISAPRGVIA